MKNKIKEVLKGKKGIFIKYIQGIDYGNNEFHSRNIDPELLFQTAIDNDLDGMIIQKEIAERYHKKFSRKIPFILKLNGKTKYSSGDPHSIDNCSVEDAIKFGANALAYTLYIGSIHEHNIFNEFKDIKRKADMHDLPLICWTEPMGAAIKNKKSIQTLVFCAKTGSELGAAIVMMTAPDKGISEIVKAAGTSKVILCPDTFLTDDELIKFAADANTAGGIVLGKTSG